MLQGHILAFATALQAEVVKISQAALFCCSLFCSAAGEFMKLQWDIFEKNQFYFFLELNVLKSSSKGNVAYLSILCRMDRSISSMLKYLFRFDTKNSLWEI